MATRNALPSNARIPSREGEQSAVARVEGTSSSIAPVAFAPDSLPLASPQSDHLALRLVAGGVLGALAAIAVALVFVWLPARENIVASSSHAAAGLAVRPAIVPTSHAAAARAVRPAIVPTYNLQPVNISAVAPPLSSSR